MKRILTILLLIATLGACIKNDIPLPVIKPRIVSMEVSGASDIYIDSEKQDVEITLNEQTDICNVDIKQVVFADELTRSSWEITGQHDLSQKLSVTLSTYQDYVWTITTKQPISRYFTVAGQVGASVIDDVNHRAVVYVSENQDITDITITSLKLGAADISTYSPAIESIKDFTNGAEVTVTAHGRSQTWTLYVEQTASVVEMRSVNAWTAVVWLKASGVAQMKNGFKYRKSGSNEWIDVSGDKLTTDGGDFSVGIDGLDPSTQYECYAYCGEDQTDIYTFTTEEAHQMPNSSFETISNAESEKYYSFYDPMSQILENQAKWWCSGNEGSTIGGVKYAITNPDNQEKQDGRYSVRLESKDVVGIKFAAGNIFVGEFAGVIGTSGGKVNFGRPFELRPRKLSVWLKYQSGKIDCLDKIPDNDPVKLGDNDRGQVFIALGDWDYRVYGGTAVSPVQVNTTNRSTFFDPKSENVIGYGSLVLDESTDGWIHVEIPIEYTSTSRKPTHIIVSCASSMLGDYFTGSSKSILWLDKMELIY